MNMKLVITVYLRLASIRPLVGAHFRRMENTIIKKMATQKYGIDMPVMATIRTTLSTARRRVATEITPAAMPSTVLMNMATNVNSTVGGIRSNNRTLMGVPELIEMPRSPRNKLPIKCTYWT